MRALLVGWFSFEGMGATAGDLLAADVARSWLTDAGVDVAVAWAPPFSATVDWRRVDPEDVDAVVFVCGPFGNGPPLQELLHHFRACRLIGLDVTMLEPLQTWNPFDLLIERDSSRRTNPDLALAAPTEDVPVVGMVLMREQPEYGERDRHRDVNERLETLVASPGFARVSIDTRLDVPGSLLRTPAEVTSLLARVDVVLTSRLHGLVLALRSGIPVVAVDPVAGGAKITRQAAALEWPWCFGSDVSPEQLAEAFTACRSAQGRAAASAARRRALEAIDDLREELVAGLEALDTEAARR
jgi:polysaccharide pyruvyl transferase